VTTRLVLHVLEQAADCSATRSDRQIGKSMTVSERTDGSEVDDMSGLVLSKESLGCCRIPVRASANALPFGQKHDAYRRSPSPERAKTQVSPARLPKREPSGSVSITCWIAAPTSPLPPVTRITSGIVHEGGGRRR
jgi:hypothetical protein